MKRSTHRTQEGQRLYIDEMDDRHLQNTIALKRRQLRPYLLEAQRRGIASRPPWYRRIWYWSKRRICGIGRKLLKKTRWGELPIVEDEMDVVQDISEFY